MKPEVNQDLPRPQPKAKAPQYRLPFLDGIRGLAALYVVLGHICTLSDPSVSAGKVSHAPAWLQQVAGWFSYGHLAVAAFIVLSGFCLELSLIARDGGTVKSLTRFLKRRAQRILPPYYVCLGISLYVALTITTKQVGRPFAQYLPVDRDTILAHIFMVHNFSVDWMYKINGVLWSIAIESQLYLIFPILVFGINRIGRIITLTSVAVITYELMLHVPQASKLYLWFLPLFLAGMVSANLAFRPGRFRRLPRLGTVLALGAAGLCWYGNSNGWPLIGTDLCLGICIASICYALTGLPQGPIYRILMWKPVVILGAFSYSLYLMHHPIAQVLYANRPEWAEGEVNLFWYFVASLPLILFLCWIFYLFFERPFMPKRTPRLRPKPKDHAPADLPLRPYRQVSR